MIQKQEMELNTLLIQTEASTFMLAVFGAGDGSRTRRNQLGKLTPYR